MLKKIAVVLFAGMFAFGLAACQKEGATAEKVDSKVENAMGNKEGDNKAMDSAAPTAPADTAPAPAAPADQGMQQQTPAQ